MKCAFLLLIISTCIAIAQPLHNRLGPNAYSTDTYGQVFHFELMGSLPLGAYRFDIGEGDPALLNFTSRTYTASYVFTMGVGNPPRGRIFSGVVAYQGRNGVMRTVGHRVTWLTVNYPSGSTPPAAKYVEDVFHVKVYPVGTNLDEVDPLPPTTVESQIGFNVTNHTISDIPIRMVVDGEVAFQMEIPAKSTVSETRQFQTEVAGGEYSFEYYENGQWHTLSNDTYGASDSGQFFMQSFDLRRNVPAPVDPPPGPVGADGDPSEGTIDQGNGVETGAGGKTKNPGIGGVNKGGGGTLVDVYDDVRAALNQAGGGDTDSPGIDAGFEVGEHPDAISSGKGKVAAADIGDTVSDVTDRVGAGTGSFFARFSDKPIPLPAVPSTKRLSWTLEFPVLGSFTVSLLPFETYINILRSFVLLIMYITFWFITIHVIRESIA